MVSSLLRTRRFHTGSARIWNGSQCIQPPCMYLAYICVAACFSSALKDTSSRRQGKRDSSVEKGSVLSRRKETLNAATHAADGMQRDNAVEQKRREEGEDDQEVLSIEKRNRDDCCYSQHSDDTTHPRTFDLAWLWTLLLSFLFCNSGRKTTETNENKKKRERTQRGGNVFWRAVGRSGVLGVLGFFRFLLLLLCDYHVRKNTGHETRRKRQMSCVYRKRQDNECDGYWFSH